jgi:ABC-type bacteriocin/lantibiotic exporter with double-glycine peptidase domain
LLKKIYSLLGIYKKKVFFILFVFILNTGVEIVGVGLVIPYINILFDVGFNIKFINNVTRIINQDNLVYYASALMLIVFFLKFLIGVFTNHIILKFSYSVQSRLRIDLMKSYTNLDYQSFIKKSSSYYIDLIHRLTGLYQGLLVSLLRVLSEGFIFAIILFYLLVKAWAFVLILSLTLLPIILIYDWFIRNRLSVLGEESTVYNESMVKSVKEFSTGFKFLKVLGISDYFNKKLSLNAELFSDNQCKYLTLAQSPRFLVEFLVVLFILMVVVFTQVINLKTEDAFAYIALFGVVAIRFKPIISVFTECLSTFRFSRSYIDILYGSYHAFDNYKLKKDFSSEFKNTKISSFRMEKINFEYNHSANFSLIDIDLYFNKGEAIGIIGPSGSGKTTLVDILLGLIRPSSGSIYINDLKVENGFMELHSTLAYLPQENFIIEGTLKENIALGLHVDEIDIDLVRNALESANLGDFVDSLPDGLDTCVGEDGVMLSGGQKQRVGLARVLYFNRDIIIMDEATSALDSENERKIIDEINSLKGEKTLIVIAHRLSTVHSCDRIYKLDSGKILKCGTPNEILL